MYEYVLLLGSITVDSGIEMTSSDNLIHSTDWVLNKNFYIRCKDRYGNQPSPNTCTIVARPSQIDPKGSVIEL